MKLRTLPIDFDAQGRPRNPKLHSAVQRYCLQEFGKEMQFYGYYLRAWTVIAEREDDPSYFEVIGVTTIRNTVDVPTFHTTPPTPDKAGMQVCEQARDMMIGRLRGYIEDNGMSGSNVLIFVSERAQRYWRRFLVKLGAKQADRYELTI